ncbi:spermine/spermidine synthase domain-containing protein [Kaarinaea lacus]
MNKATSVVPPRIAIAVISAAALAYEVLLMRLLSIIQWHHFAYMIISLALLGYGVSGTVIAITQKLLKKHYSVSFAVSVLGFSVSAIFCFLLAQQLPFNPEQLFWDWRQPLWSFVLYLLLALPFFFAATAVGLSLCVFKEKISQIYAMDLLGAGFGSIVILLMLFTVFPEQCLLLVTAMGFIAALISWLEMRQAERWPMVVALLGIVILVFVPNQWLAPNISPYKSLPQLLNITGSKIVEQYSSPLGLISVVENKVMPLRHAPGLGLTATTEPPQQLAVFTDADAMTAITKMPADLSKLAYLDAMTSALAYHLHNIDTVAILGVGGGADVLQAKFHGVEQLDAVELNQQMADLLKKRYANYSGNLFATESYRLYVGDARGFISSSERKYDLIQVASFDAFNASATGLYALNENYLYTSEALVEYLMHITDKGYVSLNRWVQMPPRDMLKLFATAIEALQALGIEKPGRHLALIRNWQTSTLLIKKTAFSSGEVDRIRQFSHQRGFDVSYFPGINTEELNQFNQLLQPYYYIAARELLGEGRDKFHRNYKFNIQAATDDQPYFSHFFKWSSFSEILMLSQKGGLAFLEWGYLLLIATFIQAIIASLILIVLPLRFIKRYPSSVVSAFTKFKVFIYFGAIGLAFLFIEIAFIQKFILFLQHPVYSIAVLLVAFLIFAGLGSAYSQRFSGHSDKQKLIWMVVFGIFVVASGYYLALDMVFALILNASIAVKSFISLVLVAPLAFLMGMPFPLAMSVVGKQHAVLVPWAWGINGCASVVSAVLATILAMQFGFIFVVFTAVILYALAAMAFPDDRAIVT